MSIKLAPASMRLKNVLILKIAVTGMLWSALLLFIGEPCYLACGFPPVSTMVFIKLLGAAYGSLMIGYVHGLVDLNAGRVVRSTVFVGIISNASAFAILFANLAEWHTWGHRAGFLWVAPVYMWTSLGLTGLITLGLVVYGILQNGQDPSRPGNQLN